MKKIILIITIALVAVAGIAIALNVTNNIETNGNIENDSNFKDVNRIASVGTEKETISLEIPEKWEYEIIDKEDEENYYRIKFYLDSEDKCVELYSRKDIFAVCGTELTTEKTSSNNDYKMIVGYYSESWDFVAFQIEGTELVAFNKGLENEEAKEAIDILKTLKYENK